MVSVEHNDPINEKILAISEDKIEGFVREPFEEIAERSGVEVDVVMARIGAMLRAGTIRRVRQTLLATNLADGALVAWKVGEDKMDAAFDFMFQRDPFSGHVVLRSTDTLTAGSDYKLWTTVKVPHGFSLEEHCRLLAGKVGAERFRIMPAKGIFTLGVGHVRRKAIEPGSRADIPAKMIEVRAVELSEREWAVLLALITGYALFFFISKHVHHVCPACAASHFDADATRHFSEIATALIVALAIHSTTDGLALGIQGETPGTGATKWSLFSALCIHKVPEGLALGGLLIGAGLQRAAAVGWVAAVEATTLLGGVIGYFLLTNISMLWLGLIMAHVGGGFIYLATHAVVGEMLKHGKKLVLTSFALGIALIAVLNIGLRLVR